MSDYECVCEPAEADACLMLASLQRTARKRHQCCECAEPIQPGERYHYDAVVFEGEFYAYKTCAFCHSERNRISKRFLVAFGDLACCLVAECRGEL
jgi:hypothetical protein